MDLTAVQCGQRIAIAFSMVADSLGSQLLDGNEDANTIPNFLDAHLFEHELVTFDKIIASNIVDYCYALVLRALLNFAQHDHVEGYSSDRVLTSEELFILSAVDGTKPFTNAFLIPGPMEQWMLARHIPLLND